MIRRLHIGALWAKPKYQEVESEIFAPLPKEVGQFVASCSPMMSTFMMLLSETTIRPSEGLNLRWKDFDATTRTVRIRPEKGSHSGTAKLTEKLAAKINDLPRTYETIFCKPGTDLEHFSQNHRRQRARAVQNLKNPSSGR